MKLTHIIRAAFAGYWEYLLDEALLTAPAHPEWGGAGLIDQGGQLVGIGSLLVQSALGKTGGLAVFALAMSALLPAIAALPDQKKSAIDS